MKLLIFTQKVNQDDPVLGFMCSWIKEFAKNCEKVTIICLEKCKYQLPPNVKILSLGKEEGHSKLKYLLRFYLYIWRERKNYDVIFSHMNPEYIIFGGFLWRFWKKKISLWYANGFASLGLKIAEKLVDIIFTSTRSGCRLSSSKIKIVGQGIDTNFFKPPTEVLSKKTGVFNLISIGRISPIKNYGLLVKALEKLKGELLNIKAIIIGSPILPKDYLYLEFLNSEIKQKKLNKDIIFLGSLPNDKILPHLY